MKEWARSSLLVTVVVVGPVSADSGPGRCRTDRKAHSPPAMSIRGVVADTASSVHETCSAATSSDACCQVDGGPSWGRVPSLSTGTATDGPTGRSFRTSLASRSLVSRLRATWPGSRTPGRTTGLRRRLHRRVRAPAASCVSTVGSPEPRLLSCILAFHEGRPPTTVSAKNPGKLHEHTN